MSLEAGGGIPGLPSPAATAIKISKIGFFIYFKKNVFWSLLKVTQINQDFLTMNNQTKSSHVLVTL